MRILAKITGCKVVGGRRFYGWSKVFFTSQGQYVEPTERKEQINVVAGEHGSAFELNDAEVLNGSIQELTKLGPPHGNLVNIGFGFDASPKTWTVAEYQRWKRAFEAKADKQ